MKLLLILFVVWFPVMLIIDFLLYERMKESRPVRLLAAGILAVFAVVFYPLTVVGVLVYIVYRIDKRCNPEVAPQEEDKTKSDTLS